MRLWPAATTISIKLKRCVSINNQFGGTRRGRAAELGWDLDGWAQASAGLPNMVVDMDGVYDYSVTASVGKTAGHG